MDTAPDPGDIDYSRKKPINYNGCVGGGKVKLEYVGKGAKGLGCDPMRKLDPEFERQLNGVLCQCFEGSKSQSSAVGCNVKLDHDGTMGDKSHEHKGSYHNEGLAIDVRTVHVSGKKYTYNNPADQAYFDGLRKCWSEKITAFGCANGRKEHAGSIGKEDEDHKNHLHLSLPCKKLASNKKNMRMVWDLNLLPLAFAETIAEPFSDLQEANKARTIQKEFDITGGKIVFQLRETGGEPISADTFVTMILKCRGKQDLEMAKSLQMCSFDKAEYKDGAVELTFRTPLDQDGMTNCLEKNVKRFPVTCR